MADAKPTSWSFGIRTTFISLNNDLGTLLTLVLGFFPLDKSPYHVMSDCSIFISRPSESKNPLIDSSRTPNVRKKHLVPYPSYKQH